jgi:hypothetical protein
VGAYEKAEGCQRLRPSYKERAGCLPNRHSSCRVTARSLASPIGAISGYCRSWDGPSANQLDPLVQPAAGAPNQSRRRCPPLSVRTPRKLE